MLNQIKQEKIAHLVIKVLLASLEVLPKSVVDNLTSSFYKAFLSASASKFNLECHSVPFLISPNALDTTLGQTFFEKVAHILSDGEKREYTSKKLGNKQILETQKNNINEIMTKLSNSQDIPNLPKEDEQIFINDTAKLVNALDFSADVFIEDDQNITAIELKSVKPNSGEMRGEKQKILEGKAAFYKMFPNKNIKFFVGFPFDPTSDTPTDFNKIRFLGSIINMTKFFDPDETLVAKELWDYLSGEANTMEKIIEIINKISSPEFMEKFNFINDSKNIDNERYSTILKEWFLFSETELVEKNLQIKKSIQNDQRLQRIYNQQIFKKEEYNWERAEILERLLQNKLIK